MFVKSADVGAGARLPAYTGSCLCGGVQFAVRGTLAPIEVCHCQQCRKAQGTPFVTNIPVASSAFSLMRGAELLSVYESSPGKQRVFCSRCGSPIFSRRASVPGVVRLRAGTLDDGLATRPAAHFHVDSKVNWWPLDDGLPQFPQGKGEVVAGVKALLGK